jgi:hypothetical protein
MCAQVSNVLAIENFGAVNIKKIHNRVPAGIVFETQHVAEFVHRGGIQLRATHFISRSLAYGDLPAKVGPLDDLRSSHGRVIQNIGPTSDNPYSASAEVIVFIEVHGKRGVPEPERPAK